MTTTQELIDLRKLAEAATPGKWTFVNHSNEVSESQPADDWSVKTAYGQFVCSEPQCKFIDLPDVCDGAYIAAANPTKVIALLDHIESLSAENSRLLAANRDCVVHFDTLKADYDKVSAEVERLKALGEMSLATIQNLQNVSNEYNAWIRCHAGGGDYDYFLKRTLEGTA